MIFHAPEDPGQSLKFQEAQDLMENNRIKSKLHALRLYWTFLPQDLLKDLLAEPNCVGVRLYNAFREASTCVVVGVLADGSEIQETQDGQSGYVLVSFKSGFDEDQGIDELQTNRVPRLDAGLAVRTSWGVLTGGGLRTPDFSFASFFSRDAIQALLKPQGCNGVNFYVVGMLKKGKFPFTHLAVSAQHESEAKRVGHLGQVAVCILCPKPCPQHCAADTETEAAPKEALAEAEVVLAAPKITSVMRTESDEAKYLLNWM